MTYLTKTASASGWHGQKPSIQENGSDGTRTRDLRRDRPTQARRRVTTNFLERLHLQGFLTPEWPKHRMVEPNW